MENTLRTQLQSAIRSIPDYPKKGVIFRDVTTLFGDADAFSRSVDALVEPFVDKGITQVAGIEARGFILGGAMAHRLSSGFVPVRKPGKLPRDTISVSYELEYGEDRLELHKDAVEPGQKVLLVDDLIATGGTAEAAIKLLRQLNADIVAACFIIDLPDLGGADLVKSFGIPVQTLIEFEGD